MHKASVIIFCKFFPPRRSTQYNLYISKMHSGSHWAERGLGWFTFRSHGVCCRQSCYCSEWRWNLLVIEGLGLRRHLIFSAQGPILPNRHRCVQRGAPEPVLRLSQELVLMGTQEAWGWGVWRKLPQALSAATGGPCGVTTPVNGKWCLQRSSPC